MWERARDLPVVINEAWTGGGKGCSLADITKKLRNMQDVLSNGLAENSIMYRVK